MSLNESNPRAERLIILLVFFDILVHILLLTCCHCGSTL